MQIVAVRGRNFCCLRDFEIPLRDAGLTLIVGVNDATEGASSNGAGKSTLYKACTWGLFGKTIDGDEYDRIVRRGTDEAEVEVELEDEKGTWKIQRARKKGSPSLAVIGPDGSPIVAKKEEIQDEVVRLLGFDFETFRNTVLFGQGDIQRFASSRLGDVERKGILHRIMRTERLREAERLARDRANAKRKEIATTENELARLQGQRDEYDLEALDAKVAEWEADRTERYDAEVARAKELLAEAKSIEREAGDVEAYEEEQRSLVEAIRLAEAKEKRLAIVREEIGPLVARQARAAATEAAAEEKLAHATEERDQLKGDACTLCESPLNQGKAGEKRKRLRAAFIAAEGAYHAAVGERAEADRVLAEKRRAEKVLKAAVAALPANREKLDEVRAQLADARNAKARVKAKGEEARAAVARAKEIKAETNPHAETREAAAKRWAELDALVLEKTTTLGAQRVELGNLEFWVRGFGGQGIPSFVLEAALPYVTERANHYLSVLADGDLSIELSATRTTAKGETRDKIDVRHTIEGLTDVTPSGGQERKFEIATDLALMDLAARELGRPPLLMFDEVLDGLDLEGQERVIKLLHELRGRFGSIFVITHEADISEAFEHVVRVTKAKDGSSTVEVVS